MEHGGKPQACGWITDRYGVRWQITASSLPDMIADKDRTKARRATDEMMKQIKIDIARLTAAFEGK